MCQWPVSHSGCICCHLASDSLTLTGGIQNRAFGQWPELSEKMAAFAGRKTATGVTENVCKFDISSLICIHGLQIRLFIYLLTPSVHRRNYNDRICTLYTTCSHELLTYYLEHMFAVVTYNCFSESKSRVHPF